MQNKNHYVKAPIIEVLCQIRFLSSKPWDVTVPGVLFEKVKSEFPIKEQVQHLGFGLNVSNSNAIPNIQIASPIRFYRQDKTQLIQIAQDMLAINQLPPYPRWEIYKPLVENVFKSYVEISAPNGIRQITLRYINCFQIPSDNVVLQDYFRYFPSIDQTLPQDFTKFHLRTEFQEKEHRENHVVAILSSRVQNSSEHLPVILDLEHVISNSEDLKMENFSISLEKAHDSIEHFFESCLTDKAKTLCEIR